MMIRVNGEYLDFNGSIEIERKVKLFEDIETTDGDVSFAFELQLTSNNIRVLNIPFPDNYSKSVYHIQDTEVLTNEGILINKGSIRIESITGRLASCSFFGGNSNWFSALSGNLTDLDLSQYDVELSSDDIIDSWDRDSGIIYPIMDTGTMITRGFQVFVTEDFIGCFYVHTLMSEVFKQSGIKIRGELIDDPFYKSLVVVNNSRSMDDIDNRKSYVGKTSSQSIAMSPTVELITFDNDSVLPYFDGSQDNFSLVNNRYTADIDMRVQVSYNFVFTDGGFGSAIGFVMYKNGVAVNNTAVLFATSGAVSRSHVFNLSAGEYIDVRASSVGIDPATIESGSITVTPIFLYQTYGNSSVPKWTKQNFVSNIFKLFNCICSYDEYTKTVTVNYFDKIKEKTNIDISPYSKVDVVDYTEFISNYAKENIFTYQEGNDENLKEYNISSFIKYGAGVVPADNDFLEPSTEVVESDFTPPISYVNGALNASLERINFVEFLEEDELEITSVADDGSENARFAITDASDYFSTGDIVRIDTTEPSYNADFRVTTATSTYIDVARVDYVGNATGTATKMTHKLTTDSNVYLMSVTQKIDNNDFSDTGLMFVEVDTFTAAKLAFFNMIRLGHPVEENYTQGLSFDRVNDVFSFQRTLLDTYWRLFSRIVNDPVMLKTTCYLPWKVYNSITFMEPIEIRSLESSNQYYCNRIVGYNNSYTPCLVELIKLP